MRHLKFGTTFVFFGSNVQKTNARTSEAHAVAGIRGAHQRVGQKVVFVGANIGPCIKHHVEPVGVPRGPEASDGRTVHTFGLAQTQHRQRHQRTSVAA